MSSRMYFCGVDVAKDSFVVSIKNGEFLVKNKSFRMNKAGFEEFEQIITDLKTKVFVGMEPTGIYHNNLLNFLQKKNYNSIVVNPYILHQFFKFTNNKPTKTDKKDSKTIAEFLEFKQDELNKSLETVDERYSVRYFVREKERITQDIARTKTEIKRMLSLVFPEAESVLGVYSQEFLSLLLEFGGAAKIRSIPKASFITIANQVLDKAQGRRSKFSPEEIYELASSSIAGEWPDYEELLKIKIRRLQMLLEEKKYITKLIEEKAEKFFKTEIEILSSIPGVGKESAIYLMAEIVDIKRFENHRKLVGFCGLDPVIKQSGRFKASLRISKRENAHARRILWIMASCVKRSCPYFREYYLKKRNEGKPYKEAVIATSTKLLRTIYALLNENRAFK
ncbi:MAG: IS110 family transposase [Myxococcota bacterium]